MEAAHIIPVNIEDEMRSSYMDYAMSVIISRALPDVRDGLKPVHRRILYAMFSEGLTSGKKYSKCAGVVGEVLKKFHPHGDSAVYNALVRLAQHWNLRYPLIDGQGNFGSVDGDSAAAYRYTECRMRALAEQVLADIDKDTVDFTPNFDDTTKEPVVLPSRIPNLLINGAEGIAVGMASSIPPHNITEVITATIALIRNPEVSLSDLMEIIPGPDFPTAGIIYGASPIRQIYATGRGILKLRAKTHIESLSTGKREAQAIVVDEIPYQVNKARLVEKIAELVNHKKIDGISRLRDESDRSGMRIVIELKRDAVDEVVLNQLFKLTPLQQSYGVTMRAIVDGRPRILTLAQMLTCFIEHRREIVRRRSLYELQKAKSRVHILEGLRIALDHIDKIIQLIRSSDATAEARIKLQAEFGLSEIQAQHILDMPLKRLTGLERKAIEDEYSELVLRILDLESILADRERVDRIIVGELEEIRDKFADPRRTVIEENGEEIELEDLIAEEDMVVTISHKGYVKRCSTSLYRSQKRGGKGVLATKRLAENDEDFIEQLFVASTHAYLLVFTNLGRLYWIKVYQLPEGERTARGRAIVNMIQLDPDERVSAILPVREFDPKRFVVMLTKQGFIKRIDLMDFANVRAGGIRATTLSDDDQLIAVQLTHGADDCLVSTRNGIVIRFPETDVRVMGRIARGCKALTLRRDDVPVSLTIIASTSSLAEGGDGQGLKQDQALITICEKGYGKRTLVEEYRVQGRGGMGVIDIKTSERNGSVVGCSIAEPLHDAMLITTSGKVIRTPINSISLIGRNTMGVRIVNLEEGEKVASIAQVAEADEEVLEEDVLVQQEDTESESE